MIPIWFFQTTGACVTLSYPRVQISAATIFLKADIRSHPLSIFVVQNKGSDHSKQIIP